jgi:serine/threonine-protein kinase RsbT
MDEFAIASDPGHGTTVTMTKWERTDHGRPT